MTILEFFGYFLDWLPSYTQVWDGLTQFTSYGGFFIAGLYAVILTYKLTQGRQHDRM
jgi:hypothetical protein